MFDGFRKNLGLAMAGKKNPWGNPGKSGGESGSGDESPSGGDSGDDSSGGSDGPRNPWLPGGGGGNGKRRSASVEDIFKNRGPEGPRRSGGGGGGGFQMPELPGGRSWVPLIIGGIIVIWLLVTSVHQIEPEENAVVKTFGSYSETLTPGFYIRAPYPIQSVDIENVTGVRQVDIPDGSEQKLILTGDQNLVDLAYVVRWRINNLRDFRFELAEPEVTINEVAEAAMRGAVAERTLDETFSGQGRAAIQQAVRESMQDTLDTYRAGVLVEGVELTKADPPEQVNEAFRDVSVAEQNADRARNQARGYAQSTIATAEGRAEAFNLVYQQYRLAPGVTRQRLYYETMERILAVTDTTVIEADGVTPYLPLPEIRRRAQQQSQITVEAPAPERGQ